MVSDFSGSSEVYGVTASENGLYQVKFSWLEKVMGINGVYVGNVTDVVEFDNNLVFSARFRDSAFSYGHELVKVFAINDDVQFVLDEAQEFNLLMEANSGSFALASSLSVSDTDEADTVVWDVMSAPGNGSIVGLPYQATSNGLMLSPETVNYQPNLGFIGRDNFEIRVTDGFSESILKFNLTISQTASEPTIVNTQRSSGGTMGWFLVCFIVLARRLFQNSVRRS